MNHERNYQKTVDRMRKKITENKGEPKICLVLLIRNQSNNVKDLLDSLKSVINMISIIDIRLPDDPINNIIDFILDWCKNNDILTMVNKDPFRNIPYNKTNSIKISRNKFQTADYFLLSELDFIWDATNFNKNCLSENKYDVMQNKDYYRTSRLLSSKIDWVCHLKTYEYWVDSSDKLNYNGKLLTTLSIKENVDNYNDNLSLLLEDLNDSNIPKNDKLRVKFYLGYVLRNLERFEESISYSLERIKDKGCKEELYYATYNIGMSYEESGWKIKQCIQYMNKENKNNDDIKYIEQWNSKNLTDKELLTESAKLFSEAISYYKKAYDFRPTRSESLYSMSKLYRKLEVNDIYILAYQTIKIGKKILIPNDYLFVNYACYDYLFDLELIIISHLIPSKKLEGKEALARLLNRGDLPSDITEIILLKMKYYF